MNTDAKILSKILANMWLKTVAFKPFGPGPTAIIYI